MKDNVFAFERQWALADHAGQVPCAGNPLAPASASYGGGEGFRSRVANRREAFEKQNKAAKAEWALSVWIHINIAASMSK